MSEHSASPKVCRSFSRLNDRKRAKQNVRLRAHLTLPFAVLMSLCVFSLSWAHGIYLPFRGPVDERGGPACGPGGAGLPVRRMPSNPFAQPRLKFGGGGSRTLDVSQKKKKSRPLDCMLIPHSHLSAGLLDRSNYFFVRFGVRYNQCRMYRTPYINVYFIHVLRGIWDCSALHFLIKRFQLQARCSRKKR
jgi:hypothetical protein